MRQEYYNDFVKPEDQRGLARFGLARNRTFKNDFVKPEDQRGLARFGLARNRTFKNAKVIHYFQSAKH